MAPELGDGELILRLVLAVVLSGVLGLEREARGQVAGLRTHMLVGLGASLFTLISAHGFDEFLPAAEQGDGRVTDPTRIAAQIVTGIGFLGAGAILRYRGSVRGLTTAAGLWAAAAVGMGAGAGFYLGTVVATLLALLTLAVFRPLRELVTGDDAEVAGGLPGLEDEDERRED